MEIALFIQNIQEERAEVALYIFINQVVQSLPSKPKYQIPAKLPINTQSPV